MSQAQAMAYGALRPLTVLQVLNATQAHSDADFEVDKMKVKIVTVVGHVIDVQETPKMHKFYIEDGSPGRVMAQRWIDADKAGNAIVPEQIPAHCYVRIIAKLGRFSGVNRLEVQSVRRVIDMHEPFHHLLEAMIALLHYDRIPSLDETSDGSEAESSEESSILEAESNHDVSPPTVDMETYSEDLDERHHPAEEIQPFTTSTPRHSQQNSEPSTLDFSWCSTIRDSPYESHSPDASHTVTDRSIVASDSDSDDEGDFVSVPTSPHLPPHSPSPEPQEGLLDPVVHDGCRDPYSYMTSLQRDVLLQIKNNETSHGERGVPVTLVCSGLNHRGVTSQQISQAIEELLDEGLIYTTGDDDDCLRIV